jgi:CHAT domain-containing protein
MKKTSHFERLARVWLAALMLLGCRARPAPVDESELRSRLARASDPASALQLAETVKCRTLRARLLAAGITPHALPLLDRVSLPLLADDEAILSLYQDGARVRRLWARGSSTRELAARDTRRLEALIARARDELELGALRGGALAPLLASLEAELLEGADRTGLRRLLVSPDGLTRAVPVHALLAATVDVAYVPCLGLLRPRTARRPERARVLVPAYGREARPLAGAAEEADLVRAALGPATSVALGAEATPARLEEALGAPGALVHFGGHGLSDLQPGRGPELVFPDGTPAVDAVRLTRQPVRASLVVLASCATADVARFRDGQRKLAAVTMPDALLAAGAEHVVAASWAVKDRQSALQMATFYRSLRQLGPAGALALAQRRARDGFEPPHPRFWAFYAVYGGW